MNIVYTLDAQITIIFQKFFPCILPGNRLQYWYVQPEDRGMAETLTVKLSLRCRPYNVNFGPAPIPSSEERKGFMNLETEKGKITIASDVFTNITGAVATSCYGVKGMAMRSTADGLVHLLRKESMAKGVKVRYHDDATVSIELHIIVDNGVNLTAVSRSIMSEVRYHVSRITGVEVKRVDVCVDSMVIG